MAKKSHRRSVRQERDQSGCMWGLISMFDFRQGRSTQRLLSDRRRGTKNVVAAGNATDKADMLVSLAENCQGTSVGEESLIAAVDTGKPSVKRLMEEEMFSNKGPKKEISSAEVESKQSNSENGSHKGKDRRRTSRSRTNSCEIRMEDLDASEKLEIEKPCIQNLEKQSTNGLDMNDMMEEFCHQIHQISCLKQDKVHDQLNQKNPDLEEKLSEAIQIFLSQKIINGKHAPGDGDIYPADELKDALKLLISDEETSLNLLQHQKSVMVKYVENLWSSHKEKDKVSKPLVGSNFPEQEIHDLKQSDEVVHGKQRKFFRRKAKSVEKNPLKESKAPEASNRIVILKPGPTTLAKTETEGYPRSSPESQFVMKNKGPNERIGSYFFLTEIKRRLKQAMGKEQQEISPDGISKRFPHERRARGDSDKRYKENVGRNSPSKDHFFIEKIARPPVGAKKRDKTDKLKECEISMEHETAYYPNQRLSNIYVEAKKHLSEMITSGTGNVDFSSGQVSKTLGRILSLPEYNFSPIDSPGRNWEQNFTTAQMRLAANGKFQKQENSVSYLGRVELNAETELCVSDYSTNNKAESSSNQNSSALDENVISNEVEKTLCSTGDGLTFEGLVDFAKASEIVVQEGSTVLDILSEPSASSAIREDRNADTSEVCDAKRYSECLQHDLHEEYQPPSSPLASPSTSSITKKDDDIEGAIEVLERPSPVSVLEPLFTEEDISPASTRRLPVELPVQPQRIKFEEHDPSAADLVAHLKGLQDKESLFEYIKEVLQTSGENWDEFYIMSNSSDPLLDPSIFDEVGLFPDELGYDRKLIFDCINEVLMEIYGRYFGCPLGLSFAKPNIRPAPDMTNTINEVWEGVYWYLLPFSLPYTLEQIVKKDMAKSGTWLDLRSDTETMIVEIGEAVFKDLIEETMLSCVNETSENESHCIPAELKDESSTDLQNDI